MSKKKFLNSNKRSSNIHTYVQENLPSSSGDCNSIQSIPSGCDEIDRIAPGGGIPRKSCTEVVGDSGTEKTNFSLSVCASASAYLKKYDPLKKVLFINTESRIDPALAKNIGVTFYNPQIHGSADTGIHLVEPQTIEDTIQIVKTFQHDYALIIIDSIASLVSKVELEDCENEKSSTQYQLVRSQKLSALCSQIDKIVRSNDSAVLFTNQYRSKGSRVGYFFTKPFGPKAKQHSLALQLEFKEGKKIEEGSDKKVLYKRIEVTVLKSRYLTNGTKAEVFFKVTGGYDNIYPLFEELSASDKGIIKWENNHYSIKLPSYDSLKFKSKVELFSKIETDRHLHAELKKHSRFNNQLTKIRSEQR